MHRFHRVYAPTYAFSAFSRGIPAFLRQGAETHRLEACRTRPSIPTCSLHAANTRPTDRRESSSCRRSANRPSCAEQHLRVSPVPVIGLLLGRPVSRQARVARGGARRQQDADRQDRLRHNETLTACCVAAQRTELPSIRSQAWARTPKGAHRARTPEQQLTIGLRSVRERLTASGHCPTLE